MLDIKFITANAEEVRNNCRRRKVPEYLVDRIIEIYESLKIRNRTRDEKVHEQRSLSKNYSALSEEQKAKVKSLSMEIADLETDIHGLEHSFDNHMILLPNLTHPSVTDELVTLRKVDGGTVLTSGWLDHIALCKNLDIANFADASTISGSKFYYLKNDGVLLEHALVSFAMEVVAKHGFTLWRTPDIAFNPVISKMGFSPRGESSQIYNLEGTNQSLIGTSEITLGALHSDSIIDKAKLPIQYAGISHCFRKEAGAPGKENHGLYRVHQFTKVEMFVFCLPSYSSEMFWKILSVEEEIYRTLGIPYRLVEIPPSDLGGPAYRKIDIEAWMPGRNDYGEITSCSNCTDFQSRRLKTRYQGDEPKDRDFVHNLNGTAIAVPRTIITILENFQTEDGSVIIPECLQKYMGKEIIKASTNVP